VRSLYIDCNKKFTVQLDGKSTHTIKADDFFSRRGIKCQRVFINVDEATKLKFWSSTNPDATIEEVRNVVVTGVETQLSSRQLRWKHIDEPTELPQSTPAATYFTQAAVKVIEAGWRLIVNNITLVCSKSCIQRVEWAIVDKDIILEDITDEDWSVNDYDMTASLSFDVYHSAIVEPGEQLAIRYWNYAGEALTFYLTLSGLLEKI
ncbi:MAG: hypothetical protein KAX30_07840, partial [Candidatus Atribacteria bacterium]|nr:hypothetical protein [Candidatus Atribacteria bacterium]